MEKERYPESMGDGEPRTLGEIEEAVGGDRSGSI